MGEAKRRSLTGHFDHKQRVPDAEMGPIIEARDELLDLLLQGVVNKLPPVCCERHRIQQIQASVLTTGFILLSAGLAKRFGGVRSEAVEHALRAITRETLGPGLPAFGEGPQGRCDG